MERAVSIPAGAVVLPGDLAVPEGATALVVFAHGSGSSRLSPRNGGVAAHLRSTGKLGTLLFDLLTPEEDVEYRTRFDIRLLTERLLAAAQWTAGEPDLASLALGYFGASTGAAAALSAAALEPDRIGAVVSRGGRPDLAAGLPGVRAATLLIVGGADREVLQLNRQAYAMLAAEKRLEVVPGATHLFEEAGALEQVAALTLEWFERFLA